MTSERFGMTVAAWLNDEARHRVPDHLDAVLAVTTRTRQRPAWSSLERWLPMDTTIRPVMAFAARPARLLILAVLLVALVGLVIVAVGSSQRRLPEPFGVALNGTIISSYDGDIYRLDEASGDATPLVSGDTFDFGAFLSRDGTRFLFLRSKDVPGDPAILTLMVANVDGSGLHEVTRPMRSLDWVDWSPDGTRIAFNSNGQLYVVDAAGGEPTRLPNTQPAHYVTWLPPTGDRLIFRAEALRPAIFEIRPDGAGLRQITAEGTFRNDYQSPAAAPDGLRISYTRRVDDLPQVFVLDLASGVETRLPNGDGMAQLGSSVFSPDGARVSYVRQYADGEYHVVVAPADGSGEGRTVGPRMPAPSEGTSGEVWTIFAPDGAALIVRYGGDAGGITHRLPIDGSEGAILATGTFQFVDVQRLRP